MSLCHLSAVACSGTKTLGGKAHERDDGVYACLGAQGWYDRSAAGAAYEGSAASGGGATCEKWLAFDAAVFENPSTVQWGAFISCIEGRPVGFACWEYRGQWTYGVIGHNCIVPEHRGYGLGTRQIREVLRRFRHAGLRRAMVITGDDPFFIPAQRMYLACGFVEAWRMRGGAERGCGTIRYEMDLLHPAARTDSETAVRATW